MWTLFTQLDQMEQEQSKRKEDPPVVNTQRRLSGPVDVDGTRVMVACGRAILARLLFIVHSIATVWVTVNVQGNDSVWAFALISLLIILEGSYTIIMRAGDERKWFCTSVFLYVLATAPPIWILETKLCEWRRDLFQSGESLVKIDGTDEELRLQLLEQLLLVVLIIGRWLLPKGDISREQLSQILLAYLAISSDIVEFFDVFKEKTVFTNTNVQYMVLSAWTLSLVQFPFVLTVSRARKMRVAITNSYEELIAPRQKHDIWRVFYDVDLWAIVFANSLQDIPFLLVRLFLMFERGLVTYTMLFFTCKNALIIALQTYRAFVLINDRYINPKRPPLKAPLHTKPVRYQRVRKQRREREAREREEQERLCLREEGEVDVKIDERVPEQRKKTRRKSKESKETAESSRGGRRRSSSRGKEKESSSKERDRERERHRRRSRSGSQDKYHRIHC